MKCNKNKQLLSKLVTATLVGTVGLSAFSVQAATTASDTTASGKAASTADSTTDSTQLKYVSINSTSLAEGSNYNNDGANGKDSIAIGVNASTVLDNSIAMGVKSKASKESDIAIGKGAHTEGLTINKLTANGYKGSSIALGVNAWTVRLEGVAIGASAITGGDDSFAAGGSSKTDGFYATALGYSATATSDRATALGYRSKSNGFASSAVGNEAKANGYESLSMGREAEANRISSVAIGRSAKVSSMGGVALGELSVAGTESTQLGYNPLSNAQLTANSAIMGLSDADRATLADLGPKVQKLKDEYIAKETAYNDRITTLNNELAQTTKNFTLGSPKTEEEKTAISEKIKALTSERGKLEKELRTAKKAYIESADFKAYAALVSTWESTEGAIAIGDNSTGITRQITGVAAGTADTDAVNVAQLKAAKVEVLQGDNVTVSTNTKDGYTKYTVSAADNDTKVNSGSITYDAKGAGSFILNTENNGTNDTIKIDGLKNTYVTDAALKDNTLTITRNDGETFTVKNLATKNDVADAKAHYVSINTTEKAAGTNYDNDGATGTDAIAIGGKAKAEGKSTVALGHQSMAKRENDIAIGERAETMGIPTNLSMPDSYGGSAIAIGVAAKTFQLAGIAIGSSSVAGAGNTLAIGPAAKAYSEYGVALGYTTEAAGRRSVAVGHMAKSQAYYGFAGGDRSKANGYGSIAIGSEANSTEMGTIALGMNSKASLMGSVALGERSVTNTADGVLGYNPATNAVLESHNDITGLSDADKTKLADLAAKVEPLKTDYVNKETTYHENLTKINTQIKNLKESLIKTAQTDEQKQEINKKISDLTKERSKAETDITKARKAYYDSKEFKDYAALVSTWESTEGSIAVGDTATGITRQITGVAVGTADTDAVNVAQLKNARVSFADANTNVTVEDVTANTPDAVGTVYKLSAEKAVVAANGDSLKLTTNSDTDTLITTYTLDLADGIKNKIANAADTSLSNLTQEGEAKLIALAKDTAVGAIKVTSADTALVSIDPDTTSETGVTNYKVGLSDGVKTKIDRVETVTVGTSGNLILDDSKTNSSTGKEFLVDLNKNLTLTDGSLTLSSVVEGNTKTVKLTSTGLDMGGNTITHVAPGRIAEDSTDAVNGSQLHDIATKVDAMTGDKGSITTIQGDISKVKDEVTQAKGDINTIQGDISTINQNLENKANTDLGNITAEGKNVVKDLAREAVTVTAEKDSKYISVQPKPNDAAHSINYEVGFDYEALKTDLGTGDTGFVTGNTLQDAIDKAVEGVVAGQATDDHIKELAKESVKLVDGTNTTVEVVNDSTDGEAKTYAVNVSDDAIKAAVKPELDNKANVDGSNLVLSDESVSKLKDQLGVNTVDAQVGEVTDRVDNLENNVMTLNDNVNSVNNRVNKLDRRVDKVGASAAALAALHPLQFDENDKFTVAAGVGNYKGEQAVALGGFYQANEDLLFSVGGTLGDEKMVNAGVSVRFGQKGDGIRPSAPNAVRELTDQVASLKAKNTALESTVADQEGRLAAQQTELEQQRALIEQLMSKVGM